MEVEQLTLSDPRHLLTQSIKSSSRCLQVDPLSVPKFRCPAFSLNRDVVLLGMSSDVFESPDNMRRNGWDVATLGLESVLVSNVRDLNDLAVRCCVAVAALSFLSLCGGASVLQIANFLGLDAVSCLVVVSVTSIGIGTLPTLSQNWNWDLHGNRRDCGCYGSNGTQGDYVLRLWDISLTADF